MNPERRISPRINVALAAEVEALSGEVLQVTIKNLSANGALIEGDQTLASLKTASEGAPIELKLRFKLDQQELACHCRVVYTQRQSQFCLRYGLTIFSIDQANHAALDQFVMSHL